MPYTTPRSAAPPFIPRPLAAARLMPTQLRRNPANLTEAPSGDTHVSIALGEYLKKATREIERSSWGVREEANIERSTAGVTGIRLVESDGGCWLGDG